MPRKKLSSVVSDVYCCERHRTVNDSPGRCPECLREAVCERWLGSAAVLAAKTDSGRGYPTGAVRRIAALAAGAGGACPCNCHDPAVCEVSEPFNHHDCTECWVALIGEILGG